MSISRRFFLVGAGALITTSFVSKAVAYAERTGQPLLMTPDRIEGELFIYGDGRISLGPPLGQCLEAARRIAAFLAAR